MSLPAWECLGISLEELNEVTEEREVWASLLRLLPLPMDGWMNGCSHNCSRVFWNCLGFLWGGKGNKTPLFFPANKLVVLVYKVRVRVSQRRCLECPPTQLPRGLSTLRATAVSTVKWVTKGKNLHLHQRTVWSQWKGNAKGVHVNNALRRANTQKHNLFVRRTAIFSVWY